jgi:hypothetical protein
MGKLMVLFELWLYFHGADTLFLVRSFSCLAVWVRRLTTLLHAQLAIMVGGVCGLFGGVVA